MSGQAGWFACPGLFSWRCWFVLSVNVHAVHGWRETGSVATGHSAAENKKEMGSSDSPDCRVPAAARAPRTRRGHVTIMWRRTHACAIAAVGPGGHVCDLFTCMCDKSTSTSPFVSRHHAGRVHRPAAAAQFGAINRKKKLRPDCRAVPEQDKTFFDQGCSRPGLQHHALGLRLPIAMYHTHTFKPRV